MNNKTDSIGNTNIDFSRLKFNSNLDEKGFYANGAIYYLMIELASDEKKILKTSHKLIPIDIQGKPLGYNYADKATLDSIISELCIFELSIAQANGLGTLDLQKIAQKHYSKELADYGKVNILEKDAKRSYKSGFPSLKRGETISLVDDLHAIVRTLKPSGKHIDVGCGYGKDIIRYTKQRYDSLGIDNNKTQVKGAKEKLRESGLNPGLVIQSNILVDNFSNYKGKYDVVTCAHVYQHFTLEQALKSTENALSMLKDDGIMMLILKRNVNNWHEYFNRGVRIQAEDLSSGVFKMWDPDLKKWRPGYHLFLPTEIESIIEVAGAKIIDVPTYNGDKKGVVYHDSGRNYPCIAYYLRKTKK